ncbi:MAG: hypothetical protein HRT71_05720 [Flavobacteriales bacterium]|nr:hypothetical protein [Flavobacteriales bacterium]
MSRSLFISIVVWFAVEATKGLIDDTSKLLLMAMGGIQLLVVMYFLLVLLSGIVKKWKDHKALNYGFSIALTVILLIFIEGTLRVLDKPSWSAKNYKEAGWRTSRLFEQINELGFRGQKIIYSKDDYVVLLVGDSQVEASGVEWEQSPGPALERALNSKGLKTKVVTIGSGGWGNDQQLLVLPEYFRKYRADAVVVWQTIENDVMNNIFPTHWPMDGPIKPTFWLEEGELRGPNVQMGEKISYIGSNENAMFKLQLLINRVLYLKNRNPEKGMDASWEAKLPFSYQPQKSTTENVSYDWDPEKHPEHTYIPFENMENGKNHRHLGMIPMSPRTEYGIKLTNLILGRMETLCVKNNATFSVFYAEHAKYTIDTTTKVQHWKGGYYRHSLKRQFVNRQFINRGLDTIAIPITIADWKVSATDEHLNGNANVQVMQDLADVLFKRQLVND